MGLREITRTAEEQAILEKRFAIAQDGAPTQEQLDVQRDIKLAVRNAATLLDMTVADSREKSLALTNLEDALMWAGKAIFS